MTIKHKIEIIKAMIKDHERKYRRAEDANDAEMMQELMTELSAYYDVLFILQDNKFAEKMEFIYRKDLAEDN